MLVPSLTQIQQDQVDIQISQKHKSILPPKHLESEQVKSHYGPSDLEFLDIPVVYLTEEQMTDPFQLIDSLYSKDYHKVGIVKLVPPATFKEDDNLVFSRLVGQLSQRHLQTREQTLNDLKLGQVIFKLEFTSIKAFGSNIEGYTLKQFIGLAQQFSSTYKSQIKRMTSDDTLHQEAEFWSIVDFADEYENVDVEYAADLLVTKYTSGFPDTLNSSFNLNKINKLRNGLFQALKEKTEMSGISVPWLYFGMLHIFLNFMLRKFASFCWHCEDLFLSSMNYLHAGASKIWYAIPPSQVDKFEEVFDQKFTQLKKSNPKLLHDIVCMISPIELKKHKIKILRTVQKAGEFLFTMGGTYHAGFSLGLNCSEAVNVAPTQWFQEYEKAVNLYRKQGNVKKVEKFYQQV